MRTVQAGEKSDGRVDSQIEAPASWSAKNGLSVDQLNILLLVAACVVLFFVGLWSWGFIDPGDGYFSEAAREMMERGDYVVPHLNYQIYFSKPILIFWLIISAYKTFGINEFAARFWSAALATVLTVVCYWTTRCLATRRAGLLAGLVLASSPLVVTFARMSLIDMSFSSLLGVALCSTAMTLFTPSRKWWPWIYVSLALAVLDKGPAAIVLYVIGMAAYVLISKRRLADIKESINQLQPLLGIPLFALIAVPWYIAVGLATNWLWPQVFFVFENLGRFAGHTNHKNPAWWFYLPVLGYGFFPWVLFLPPALFTSFRKPQIGAMLLFASWTVGVILFFSASLTKLQTYILPAWPAMAMLVGITLDAWISEKKTGKYVSITAGIIATFGTIFLLASGLALALSGNAEFVGSINAKWAPTVQAFVLDTPDWMRGGITIALAVMGIGFFAYYRRYRARDYQAAVKRLVIASVTGCAILGPIAFELGYKYRDADVHRVIGCLKDKPGPIAIFREFKPSVVYHLQRPIDSFFNVDQLRRRTTSGAVGQPSIQYIIAGRKGSGELMATYPNELKVIARQGDWYVFETRDLLALRLPTLEQSFTQHIDLSGGEYSWGTLPFAGGTK